MSFLKKLFGGKYTSTNLRMPDTLSKALAEGEIETIKALLKKNGDLVFSKDSIWGQTPLHLVASFGTNPKEIAELLLSKKADVNAKDKMGMTPLHLAAGAGNKEMVEVLLGHGADVNSDATKNKRGLTPMATASELGHADVAEMLRQHELRSHPDVAERNASQPSTASTPQHRLIEQEPTIQDRLKKTIEGHFQRMRSELTDPAFRGILDETLSRFLENLAPIAEMVEQTLFDRKLHTKGIGGGGTRTWLLVSVVPRDRHNSASFFAGEYPPGYSGYMNFWLNSALVKTAIAMGHDVFSHLLVYADSSAQETLSIGFGLSPLDLTKPNSCPKWIVPQESLTAQEKDSMSG